MTNVDQPSLNKDIFGTVKPPVDTVRISQRGREILIKLKRKTGIEQWNTICRWALATSLANPTPPPKLPVNQDSNIEIKWQTFAGNYSEIYALLVRRRAIKDIGPTAEAELGDYLRAHVERGLSSIQNRRDLEHFLMIPGATTIKSLS